MAAINLTGKPLVNVVRVEVITEETTPKTYRMGTSDKATAKPKISQGKEEILRVKNQILGLDRTEDIVVGYDLDLESAVMLPELFALIDGGTLTFDPVETTKVTKYEAPTQGVAVSRTPFTLNIFTEEKDTDGSVLGYAQFAFKHCKGKPVDYQFEDGKFTASKLAMESRAKKNEKPVAIDFLDTLPA
ncbi:MAG: hypothetical protein GT589_03800 [Peptoclostridium sp.]|uniref:hypothetical protein n=1 Tax=Peptoclostridium sp. TaxID=1904860 RepID=UPI00139ABF48|nr:hypothetical protein [Peptoclostridium sp.]MZQ75265.1 hypothetical protein [Peptoclostridium sp.]